jgi:hypothetical protein
MAEYHNLKIKIEEIKKAFLKRKASTIFAVWTGLEPATPCVTGRYSNQLNYQTHCSIAVAKIQ